MKYTKLPRTFEEQADLLISRGMSGDRDMMIDRLRSVNYYRLSGYWYPFRIPGPSLSSGESDPEDNFEPGTDFTIVWNRYVFDRQLRLLVMDAIERVEVAVRTQLANSHSLAHGAFGYTDVQSLPKMTCNTHLEFLKRVEAETFQARKEDFVTHFQKQHGTDHPHLPVWIVTEVMSFGTLLNFFRGSSHQVKKCVSSYFGMPFAVFDSWLHTLNVIRNICAHHGRLWNRELGVKPFIPRIQDYPDWHIPVKVEPDRLFGVLTILRYCLGRVAPQSHWPYRVRALLDAFPNLPQYMGFPPNWGDCPIWK